MSTNYLIVLSIAFAEIFSYLRGEFHFCVILAVITLLYGTTITLLGINRSELTKEICAYTEGTEPRISETL